MKRIPTIVIGGGQAGLAMSRCLYDRGVEHVVLERGRIAESWKSQRFDSLRVLSPNWQTRLPGWSYRGNDPDDFMSAGDVARYLDDYAGSFSSPVQAGVTVRSVVRVGSGYRVVTERDSFEAAAVVIATGHSQAAKVPAFAGQVSPAIEQVTAADYRNPHRLAPGGVLVVGAAAAGVQLADEIHRSGRPVTLAVGKHTRLPRRYRGRDIFWWLDRIGALAERAEDVPDLDAARRQPSLQLVGNDDGRSLDLAALRHAGVRILGRLTSINQSRASFSGDLDRTTVAADAKLDTLIRRIDAFIDDRPQLAVGGRQAIAPLVLSSAAAEIDLQTAGIATVVWATGYMRRYPWLKVPVLDSAGEIIHRGGVTPAPGLYVLGLRFLRRRNSSFIDGVGADARALSDHLIDSLTATHAIAA